jgi:release factor glutamine methyltransferase
MAHATGLTRAGLLAHPDAPLRSAEDAAFSALIERRARGEPVAYIVGKKEFYGLGLRVDRRVLIPRPETETLVERALELVPPREDGWVVADVGTGSGAIALAVAAHRPGARLYATDSSAEALDVARDNAARSLGDGWEQRVRFIRFTHGPLLADVPERVDVLCANLPYIPSAEVATLPVSVREYEPWPALDGGADGLDAYRALLADAPQRLTARGAVLMECDPRQADALLALALGALPGGLGQIVRDLAGEARVVEVRR